MTLFSLFPSYVNIFYHSPWAPHIATLPTRQWSPGADQGTFTAWDLSDIDADTMINEYVDGVLGILTEEIVFDYYQIMNFLAPDGLPVPVAYADLAQAGTVTPGTIDNKAIQFTVSWQCLGGYLLKTVLMDANSAPDHDRIGATAIAAAIPDMVTAITAATNAWASRAGTQPLFAKQAAYTLNERLRRAYHMN